MALNSFGWFYGVLFSAIYPRTALNWIISSAITLCLSFLVFQVVGHLSKFGFWFLSKRMKNLYICFVIFRLIGQIGRYISFLFNFVVGNNIWFNY
jgi:hypothetical protein